MCDKYANNIICTYVFKCACVQSFVFQNPNAHPRPISQDLAGFWDMLQLSIENISLKFDELHQLKANNWKSLTPPEIQVQTHRTNITFTSHSLNLSFVLECLTNMHVICCHYCILWISSPTDSQLSFVAACRCVLRTVTLPAWRHLLYLFLCFVLFCCRQWAAFEKLLYLPCTVGACPSPMVIFTSHNGHHRALLPHANGCHCEP